MSVTPPLLSGWNPKLAYELRSAGLTDVRVQDARCYFQADASGILLANCISRCADRIYLQLASFEARSFSELFDRVKALEWADYIPKNAAFPVNADSVRSELKSVSDIQSICKKAVVDKLRGKI